MLIRAGHANLLPGSNNVLCWGIENGKDHASYGYDGRRGPRGGGHHPLGDGMVPVASALGRHENARLALAFPEDQKHLVYGTGHIDLLGSAEVYGKLKGWLGASS